MSLLYVTYPKKPSVKKFISVLLQEKWIACAQMIPSHSQYYWKNKVEKSEEWVLFLKTHPKKEKGLIQKIKSIHPYETPCILKLKTQSKNKKFTAWLQEVCL